MNKRAILSKLQQFNKKRPNELVSVILPTYNRGYVIWNAIKSVLNQTYLKFELLIIDSGNDDTKKVVEQFIDPRIRYVPIKEKRGHANAINIGLKHANGKYICYIDSDNTYHPEFLEYMLVSLVTHPEKVIAYCAKNKVIVEYDRQGNIFERVEKIDCCRPVNIKPLWTLEEYIDTNTIMHKKDIIDVIGGWDERCTKLDDWEFVLRVYKKYPRGFLHVPLVLVDYVQIKGPLSDGMHADSDSSLAKEYIKEKHYEWAKIIEEGYNSDKWWLT